MIQEWLWSATATASRTARQLGYVRDFARYKARWKRNTQAWQPHLDRSRSFILQAAEKASRKELAVVAGSGLCLDVPLRELARIFRKVLLIDLVHPREVAVLARNLGNVELLEHDLTGALAALQHALDTGKPPVLPTQPPDFLGDLGPDLVVSANTLSTLPLIPMERLWLTGRFADTDLEDVARRIIEIHLAWLRATPGVRCLLTDLSWISAGRNETRAANPLHGTPLPPPERYWNWMAAPKPESHPDRDVVHTVGAILLEAAG
jgi:hypothetical protein